MSHLAADQTARPVHPVGLLTRALSWAVIASVVVLAAVSVVVPRLAGATPYTVLTGSMRPDLPPGSLIVVKPAAPDEIGIGSVITYQRRSGEADVVTHRVVSQGVDSSGRPVWWTKGDANDAVDPEPVLAVQVRGKVWYAVPHIGRINAMVTDEVRSVATRLVVIALLGYGLVMFLGAIGDRRRVCR